MWHVGSSWIRDCLQHWQTDSLPLSHQGSPPEVFLIHIYFHSELIPKSLWAVQLGITPKFNLQTVVESLSISEPQFLHLLNRNKMIFLAAVSYTYCKSIWGTQQVVSIILSLSY